MTLICVPMAVGQALYRVWVYGDVMCKLTSYLQGTIQYYIIKFNSILFNFSSKSCFMVLFSKRLFIHVHVYDFLHFCNLLLKVNAFHLLYFVILLYFLMFNQKMWIEINENWLYKFNHVLFFILWNLYRQYLRVHLCYCTNDSYAV